MTIDLHPVRAVVASVFLSVVLSNSAFAEPAETNAAQVKLMRTTRSETLPARMGPVARTQLEPLKLTPRSHSTKGSITMLDWNIQVGSDAGMFRNSWKRRKRLLSIVLSREVPDILCVQEALKEQIDFIQTNIPGYRYVGVGRDDGKSEGEHCAIFYRGKIECLDSGTFWLSDTPDSCENTWDAIFKRICTWARFRDVSTGKKFCIFNTHFPLIPEARDKAVKLLLQRMKTDCPRGNMILCGDFNCNPASGPWKAIQKAGFTDAEFALTKNQKRTKTFHLYGKPTDCIDAVFFPKNVKMLKHRVIKDIFGNRYPSDHFATFVDFEFVNK